MDLFRSCLTETTHTKKIYFSFSSNIIVQEKSHRMELDSTAVLTSPETWGGLTKALQHCSHRAVIKSDIIHIKELNTSKL